VGFLEGTLSQAGLLSATR